MHGVLLQFERTLIVADEDSQVSYLEGCTAPSYDKNQVPLTLALLPFMQTQGSNSDDLHSSVLYKTLPNLLNISCHM